MSVKVEILTYDDVIRGGDVCRPLSVIFEGQSDTFHTTSTYGGSPMNHLGWIPATVICPGWIGKTVGAFNTAILKLGRHDSETSAYEFLRGDLPPSHMEVGYVEQ